MKKLLGILLFIILLLLSSCAYHRYHAQNFKPDRKAESPYVFIQKKSLQKYNKVRDCSVYDNADTMREHYKKRNR